MPGRPGARLSGHGFRSSFRDWAAEQTNTPREVVEAALAHTVRNPTEAAYTRSDLFARRRQLMDDRGILDLSYGWQRRVCAELERQGSCRDKGPS